MHNTPVALGSGDQFEQMSIKINEISEMQTTDQKDSIRHWDQASKILV